MNMSHDNSLLIPISMNDFVGQSYLKKNLHIFIQSSLKRDSSLDHCLFFGPPGLGKTSLAKVISHEMKKNFYSSSGPSLKKTGEIISILTRLETGDIFFIDEIHRLPISLQETLYTSMENFYVDIVIGDGSASRIVNMQLNPFTIIGATTHLGKLTKPFRDRFGIFGKMEPYSIADLSRLISVNAKKMNIDICSQSTEEIARSSRGIPRIANNLLKRVRDFALYHSRRAIDITITQSTLHALGIDIEGFDSMDRQYLQCLSELFSGGPVGLNTLASALSESKDIIENVIEPFLIHRGCITISSRGRQINKSYKNS